MQEVKREDILLKACDLLKSGVVNRVLGWRAGEFDYDVMPAIFDCREDILENFVWNDFCYVNLSKYLIKETEKNDGKILVKNSLNRNFIVIFLYVQNTAGFIFYFTNV